jgi:hypothetical protein
MTEMVDQMIRERRERHAKEYPDGCPDWCDACAERLKCKGDRHDWPRDFSDGDTCYCGAFYLVANAVDDRPHIIEARQEQEG